MNLTLNLLHNQVDGGVHILRGFLCSQQNAARRNGNLYNVIAFLNLQYCRNVADSFELFRYLRNFFLHILSQSRSYINVSAFYVYAHNKCLLRYVTIFRGATIFIFKRLGFISLLLYFAIDAKTPA